MDLKQDLNSLIKKEDIEKPIFKPELDTDKSISEQAKDFVSYSTTIKAVTDDKFVEDLTKDKQKEIKQRFLNDRKNEENNSLINDKDNQKKFFGVNEGVAEYAGIKKDLPNRMQKILFTVLQIVQGILLFLIGIPTSIINITMDCINSIVEKFGTLADSSRKILKFIAMLGLVFFGYLFIKFIFAKFGINW